MKLRHLAHVIGRMFDGSGPDLLGVCEIESEKVLRDLVATPELQPLGYSIAPYIDSPDDRDIDVGFIYKPTRVESVEAKPHTIVRRRDTRQIYEWHVKVHGEELHVLGNHWPARSGGQYRTEPLRIVTAEHCARIIGDHMMDDPDSAILLLGDFNDEPFNRSIRTHLLAVRDEERVKLSRASKPRLYNAMWPLMGDKRSGTYYYSGANENPWSMLDQIMVSKALLKGDRMKLVKDSVGIFGRDVMAMGRYDRPSWFRKVGRKWKEGYSDHFPVVGRIEVG